jgi:hypothetical protein
MTVARRSFAHSTWRPAMIWQISKGVCTVANAEADTKSALNLFHGTVPLPPCHPSFHAACSSPGSAIGWRRVFGTVGTAEDELPSPPGHTAPASVSTGDSADRQSVACAFVRRIQRRHNRGPLLRVEV